MAHYTMTQLRNLPALPSEEIVEGILRTNRKRISGLFGSPEAGKSTLAAQLAKAVATGQPFLGCKTISGKVLYWQSEETEYDAAEIFCNDSMDYDGRIEVAHPEVGTNNVEALAAILDADSSFKLVVIETLCDFLRINDIKDNGDNQREFERLERDVILKHGGHCCFLVLHWFKKSDLQGTGLSIHKILGGTMIAAKTDAKIFLHQVSDADPRRVIQISGTRGRHRFNLEPTFLTFDDATQSSTLGPTLAEEKMEEKIKVGQERTEVRHQRLMHMLKQHEGSNGNQLYKRVGGNRPAFLADLELLAAGGDIRAAKNQGPCRNATHYYTADGWNAEVAKHMLTADISKVVLSGSTFLENGVVLDADSSPEVAAKVELAIQRNET